jgi:hypothetical protein
MVSKTLGGVAALEAYEPYAIPRLLHIHAEAIDNLALKAGIGGSPA